MSTRKGARGRAGKPRLVMIVGTHRGAGKTILTGALATVLRQMEIPVGVFKPVSIDCRRSRHGPASDDVEFLAHCADSPFALTEINPFRFRGSFVPAECARRENRWVDPGALDAALERISRDQQIVLIEGVGGVLEPIDSDQTMMNLASRWGAETVLVASANMNHISHLLAAHASMKRKNNPVSILLNRYDPDQATLAEEVSPESLADHLGIDKPLVMPWDPDTHPARGEVGQDLQAAVIPLVNQLVGK